MTEKLISFVDALIPGDNDFPKASAVGTHGILAHRLRELDGADAYSRLLSLLGEDTGTTAAEKLERDEPGLFEKLRMIVYLAYYEQPAVIQAIRGMGIIYNDAPQPLGYKLEPFDSAVDRPDVEGEYMPTALFDQQENSAS
jgi:hypothetical protein